LTFENLPGGGTHHNLKRIFLKSTELYSRSTNATAQAGGNQGGSLLINSKHQGCFHTSSSG